jgi:hypothetical protein
MNSSTADLFDLEVHGVVFGQLGVGRRIRREVGPRTRGVELLPVGRQVSVRQRPTRSCSMW